MKTSGYLVLYISENDDFELWRALCQFTPEERASVVKTALKKALLEEYSSQPASRQLSPDHESPSAVRNPLKSGADISGDITPSPFSGLLLLSPWLKVRSLRFRKLPVLRLPGR